MKIDKILWQERRDFSALFVCEHCGATETRSGYDDSFFHQQVVPSLVCKKCGKTAPVDYRPLTTKYPDGMEV